ICDIGELLAIGRVGGDEGFAGLGPFTVDEMAESAPPAVEPGIGLIRRFRGRTVVERLEDLRDLVHVFLRGAFTRWVIPAKAGTFVLGVHRTEVPTFAGMTSRWRAGITPWVGGNPPHNGRSDHVPIAARYRSVAMTHRSGRGAAAASACPALPASAPYI